MARNGRTKVIYKGTFICKQTLHWVHSNSFYLLKKFQIIRIFILAEINPKGYKHVYKFAVIDLERKIFGNKMFTYKKIPLLNLISPFFVHVDI